MKITLIGVLLFSCFHCFAQCHYNSIKKKMLTSCQDTFSASNTNHDINLLSNFIKHHTDHAVSWYQLSTLYYQSGIYNKSDSLVSLAIYAAHHYTAFANQRHKWVGYWNMALWSAYVSECNNAEYYLILADKWCKRSQRKYWDEESISGLSTYCELTKRK